MQLNTILVKTTKKKKRVGRGGKRGTTSGKGTKGQKSRAGHKMRPALRDIIKKIPKKRGANRSTPPKPSSIVVNLVQIEQAFSAGQKVTPKTLNSTGVISLPKSNQHMVRVKILDSGKLSKKLIFENVYVSKGAAKKIFDLGGEIRNVK